MRAELNKVTWPGSSDATRLTLTVIAISVIAGVYLGGLDFLFTTLLGILVR